MSTQRPPVGIDHVTVVPGNFDRDAESEETDEERVDERPEPAIFEP